MAGVILAVFIVMLTAVASALVGSVVGVAPMIESRRRKRSRRRSRRGHHLARVVMRPSTVRRPVRSGRPIPVRGTRPKPSESVALDRDCLARISASPPQSNRCR
jgi:hypothetical protein